MLMEKMQLYIIVAFCNMFLYIELFLYYFIEHFKVPS